MIPGHMHLLRTLAACVTCAAVGCSVTLAKTWSISADPSNPEDRVGFVVNQAESGDTMAIGPGTYYEHVDLFLKSLTFIGVEGAAATILDGSREIPNRRGSILYDVAYKPGTLILKGLTLVNGRGNEVTGPDGGGGAVYWRGHRGSRFEATECVFRSNSAGRSRWQDGGALWLGSCDNIAIASCTFEDNAAQYQGGCIRIETRGDVSIVDCRFRLLPLVDPSIDGGGTAILYEGTGSVLLRNNEISSSDSRVTEALTAHGGNWTLVGNRFLAEAGGAAKVYLGGPLEEGVPSDLRLELSDNVFWTRASTAASNPGYLFVDVAPGGSLNLSANTFAGCEVHIDCFGEISCLQNIFDHSPLWLIRPMDPLACNDFWPDSVRVIYGSPQSLEGAVRADPIFCDEGTGNLSISTRSPCTEQNAPEGCGRIGAGDPACSIQAVRFTSWGKLRALFR